MVNKYSNKRRTYWREIFSKLELKYLDICHNMKIVMVDIESELIFFREFGHFDIKVIFDWKYRYNDNGLEKGLEENTKIDHHPFLISIKSISDGDQKLSR